jgi:hypothetical protein
MLNELAIFDAGQLSNNAEPPLEIPFNPYTAEAIAVETDLSGRAVAHVCARRPRACLPRQRCAQKPEFSSNDDSVTERRMSVGLVPAVRP